MEIYFTWIGRQFKVDGLLMGDLAKFLNREFSEIEAILNNQSGFTLDQRDTIGGALDMVKSILPLYLTCGFEREDKVRLIVLK